MKSFDAVAAKAAGYSDEEIAKVLRGIEAAKNAGYSDAEITNFLSSGAEPASDEPPRIALTTEDQQANTALGGRLALRDRAYRAARSGVSPSRAFQRGVLDTGEGVAQLGGEVAERVGLLDPGAMESFTDRANQGRAEYQQNYGDVDPQAMRTIGSVAPAFAIPMGAATTIPRLAAQGAAVGGLLGAAQFQPENADASFGEQMLNRGGTALLGAGTGGGAALALGGGVKLAGKAINAVRGNYADPKAAELMDLSRKYGVRLQYPDISGKGKRLSSALENVPLVGTAGQRSLGHKEAAEAASQFTDKATGGATRQSLAEAARTSLLTKAENAKKVKSNLYAQAAKTADPLGDLGVTNTLKEIDRIIKSESQQVVPDTGLLSYLDEMKQGLGSGRVNNFTRLTKFQDKIQSDVSDFYTGKNAIFGKSGVEPMQRIKKALDADIKGGLSRARLPKQEPVVDKAEEEDWAGLMDFAKSYTTKKEPKGKPKKKPAISEADEKTVAELEQWGDNIGWARKTRGQPLFSEKVASYKALEKWKQADKFYAEKISPFREDVASIKAIKDPDELYKRFHSLTKAKPESVYNALTPDGRTAIRGLTVDDAFKTALTENGGKFSEAKFASTLERRQRDVGVFFKGADKAEIDGFTKLMRHAQEHGFSSADPINGARLVPWVLAGGTGAAIGSGFHGAAAAGYAGVYGVRLLFTTEAGKRLLLASSKLPESELPRIIQRYGPMIVAEIATKQERDVPRGTSRIPSAAVGAR